MSSEETPQPQPSRPLGEDELALLGEFMAEAIEHVNSIEAAALALEASPGDSTSINTIFRGFHTIKGAAGFVGLRQIGELAHRAEEVMEEARHGRLELAGPSMDLMLEVADGIRSLIGALEAARSDGKLPADDPAIQALMVQLARCARLEPLERAPAAAPEQSPAPDPVESPSVEAESIVRIKTQRLDALMNLVGELVVAELMVRESQEAYGSDPILAHRSAHLGRITRELYDLSVSLRMIPIGGTFQKMARAARDMGRKMQKEIELRISGGETELDRKIVEAVADPLLHMVRNAVDHGIEPAEERLRAGKTRFGTITFDSRHEGGEIVIEISDDGRGLDRQRIFAAARNAGLIGGGEELSDQDLCALIFHPGLSTAADVTEVSGRGVGMDVVKRNVEALRGRIEVQSAPGAGASFKVRLPLTLAVIDAFAVGIGPERYLLPITSVEESVQLTAAQVLHAPGAGEMCLVRGKPLPLVRLGELFDIAVQEPPQDNAIAVVMRDGQRRCCLLVDALLGQHQVVLKSLGAIVGSTPGFCGGTVLGDGRIALVLDVPGLIRRAGAQRSNTRSTGRDRLSGALA